MRRGASYSIAGFVSTCHKTVTPRLLCTKSPRIPSGVELKMPAGTRAFMPAELPAVVDLFSDHADSAGHLNRDGLQRLLGSIGERPDAEMLQQLFEAADADESGHICMQEFLVASDMLLAENPARCILIVGGPGSGKGRLCERLVAHCGVSHVSCGDMLRQEVQADTPLGREVSGIMQRGELVSSDLIVTLLRRRMRAFPGKRLLLDGFPRSEQNAIDFEARCGVPELALHLKCTDEKMVERILKRGQLENRADDNPETAARRLRVYHDSSAPTLAWLEARGVPIVELDCNGTQENVWSQLLAIGRLMRGAVAV